MADEMERLAVQSPENELSFQIRPGIFVGMVGWDGYTFDYLLQKERPINVAGNGELIPFDPQTDRDSSAWLRRHAANA